MGQRAYPEYPPHSSGPVGADISSVTPSVTGPIHHVTTTGTITTISPPVPDLDFAGPLYLIADSVFDWTTSGNIAAAPGTTLLAGHAYGFVYDRVDGKWHPFGSTP
jgi:hypothetical protein